MTHCSLAIAVTDAVRLRHWALQWLTGEVSAPPDACPAAYRIFLEAERCAIALQRQFDVEGVNPSFSQDARREFMDRWSAEMDRVQSARRQLRTIGAMTRAEGWQVAVLKGGVAVFSDTQAVDLVDIDLLVPPTAGNALAAALDRSGYWPVGESTPRHLDRRSRGESVDVEIHTTLDRLGGPLPEDSWDRLIPHDASHGLYRLGCSDHLWYVLEHATQDHPERRGNIRDLLLIGGAAAACSGDELENVHRRVAAHPSRKELQVALAMARAMNARDLSHDPLTYASAMRYAVRACLLMVPMPRLLEGYVFRWAFALWLGPAERREMWREIFNVSIDASSRRHVAWLEQRTPRLGRGYRVAARLARAAMALTAAVPTVLLANRIARRAVAETSRR